MRGHRDKRTRFLQQATMVRMLTTNAGRFAVPGCQQGTLWSSSQVAVDYLDDSLSYLHD